MTEVLRDVSKTTWTEDQPKEPGWYWYKPSDLDDVATRVDETPVIYKIIDCSYGGGRFQTTGRNEKFVDQFHGEWCGPLEPPTKAQE